MKSSAKKQILLAVTLYALPIIFFAISYFLNTASGEDIWQGTNNFRTSTTPNPIEDAIGAFNFNSRITDMYAWAIADFFDYQFIFGPDLIFRLLDLAMVFGVLYLTTYLIINHRPRLVIHDALIFCACFTAIIITPFGRNFYIEFSMIHNYLPLALATLIISIPYLKLLRKTPPVKHLQLLTIAIFFLGIYFGMAATITPIAFLATIIIYFIAQHKSITRPPLWFFTSIIGIIIGFCICWFAGSGVDHYTNPITAATFDYLPLSDLINNPATSIPQLLWHELYNFGITLIPLIGFAVVGILFSKNRHQYFTKSFYNSLPTATKHLYFILIVFTIIHILGASLIKAPPRLLIPAYLSGTILIFHCISPYLYLKPTTICVVFFTTIIIGIHAFFVINYHHDMSILLKEIKASPTTDICIDPDRTIAPHLPIINLSQASTFVGWATPVTIYDKIVTFCK